MAQGRLAAGEHHPRPEEQKGLLGDYYDTEFLRLAMGTLRKASRADTVAAFTELTGTYLSDVFDVCLREVEREAGRRLPDRDLLAVYLTGGYARGRPYDEDYDLVVDAETGRPVPESASFDTGDWVRPRLAGGRAVLVARREHGRWVEP